ncbi:MAG: LUD domain-containing protein [Deltaproteobacteria bacterium]|nr:LUD domain-containing protein [Deltaproteobacteria bacterium]
MSEPSYTRLYEKIEKALSEKAKRDALYTAMKRGRDNRRQAVDMLPGGEAFRKEVRATKLRCLAKQDELVDRFAEKARQRGTSVFLAKDGQAAIDYILKIARQRDAKIVAKSKSLTSEEIEVNEPLEESGLEVIETDLGELIIQQVHEKPFHLVFPAVHKTVADVAEIFRKVTGEDIPDDADAVMKAVRRFVRPYFLNADIGMTGANVGIAELGFIVIETNEGNGRLVSAIPDVHICIMGREKIVETVEDALLLMLAHPISAVGQHLTTYETLMGGRSPLGQGEGNSSRESHIIILDNGRSQMRQDPLMQDALNCIRCAACMNICPTYGVVGGHAFGYIYPGPIGIPWTAAVHGLAKAGEFAHLCVSCGLCKEICPADIDMPMMISAVKDRYSKLERHPLVNRTLMAAETMAKVGSATAPISNWFMNSRVFRSPLEKLIGIDRRRQLPPFNRKTLAKRFDRRGATQVSNPVHRVAFFADIYANYNAPELGMAAVERLESRGCKVLMPPQQSCGYPYIGYGDLQRARKVAEDNVRSLAFYTAQGYDIVSTEPTAVYCLKFSYPKLLNDRRDAVEVANRTYEYFEYLEKLENETPKDAQLYLAGNHFGFHIACHQRALGSGTHAMAYLKRRGAEVEVIETGTCCGMAGTFGLKEGMLGYELSQAVGEPLFQAFRDSELQAIITESSVCKIQLQEGTGLKVWHPLELV